jgi:hypothetical protein
MWWQSGARRDHMPGQWCEPLVPVPGAVCEDVVPVELVVLDGAVVVVTALDGAAVVLEVAALAIAAPPPPTAAVTASAVSSGLNLEGILITSFGGLEHKIGHQRRSLVGQR